MGVDLGTLNIILGVINLYLACFYWYPLRNIRYGKIMFPMTLVVGMITMTVGIIDVLAGMLEL